LRPFRLCLRTVASGLLDLRTIVLIARGDRFGRRWLDGRRRRLGRTLGVFARLLDFFGFLHGLGRGALLRVQQLAAALFVLAQFRLTVIVLIALGAKSGLTRGEFRLGQPPGGRAAFALLAAARTSAGLRRP
jgi:hypothetical protein